MRIKKALKRALVTVLAVSMVLQTPNLSALATEGGNTIASVSGSDSVNVSAVYNTSGSNVQYKDNLNDLLAGVQVKEDENSDVILTEMEKGRTYYLGISFTEDSVKQLDHDHNQLSYEYKFPANIGVLTLASPQQIEMTVLDENENPHQIKLTLTAAEGADGATVLTVTFDKSNEDAYNALINSGNVKFEIGMDLKVADDYDGSEIDFGNGQKVQIVGQKNRININGTKTWNDSNDQDGKRPEKITVNLYADGVFAKAVEVTPDASGNWTYSFTDLLQYNTDGDLIQYTIGENSVSGYTSKADGYNLTNTHTPDTITINGNKIWNDGNNQDGLRPEKITVDLYANDIFTKSVEVTPDANGNWNYSFTDLPKYKDGKEIVYTLKDTVNGYTSTLSGYNLVNTHTPETVQINGSKTWNDENDKDGLRPASITVNLYADGVFLKSLSASASTGWNYDFGTLPKYKDGVEIKYTISEVDVKGYTSSANGFNLTNTHVPGVTSLVTVDKTGFVGADGVANYKVTVTAVGDNTNVVITDAISNNSYVTLNQGSIVASPNVGSVTSANGNGFTYTIPSLKDGETVTISYTADVDYLALGDKTTISENAVNVKSTEDPDGSDDALVLTIEPNQVEPITKETVGVTGTGANTAVDWKITVNDNNWIDMGGETISDTITADLANVLDVAGAGIQVEVYNGAGTSIESRMVAWNQLNVTQSVDKKSLTWTYNVPNTDGKYKYVITYKTKVDMNNAVTDVYLQNTAKLANETAISNTTVEQTDENRIPKVEKTAEKLYSVGNDVKVDWKVTITVPAQGLDVCQIIETAPWLNIDTKYYDKFEALEVSDISGLLSGESWTATYAKMYDYDENSQDSKLTIDFYRDAAKQNTGLLPSTDGISSREVTIHLTTTADAEWIAKASVDGAWSALADHTNNVELKANDRSYYAYANVKILDSNKKYISKNTSAEWSGTKTINGVEYPFYQFTIVLSGVDRDEIKVYDKMSVLGMDQWEVVNGVYDHYNDRNDLKIFAGDETWSFADHGGAISVTPAANATDSMVFNVTVPKKDATTYYKYYQIQYTVIPTDADAIEELKELTLAEEKGKLTITNTATWENKDATVDVEYTYDSVSKVTLSEALADDYIATYQIQVNPSGIQMNGGNDLEIIDTMSSSLNLMHETLVVKGNGNVLSANQYTYALNGNELTIKVPDEMAIEIVYSAHVIGKGEVTYSNSVKVGSAKDEDTVNNSVVMNATGTGGSNNYIIHLMKMDAQDNSIKLEGATFKLQEYDETTNTWVDKVNKNGAVVTVTTDAEGKATFFGSSYNDGWWLEADTRYRAVEIQAPAGYDASGETTEFIIKSTPENPGEYATGSTLYITNEKGVTSVSGTKTWEDDNNRDGKRPDSIVINLLKNGAEIAEKKVTAADGWSYSFNNLPKYDGNTENVYTVTEDKVDGYTPTITGYDVTNTYTPEKTSVVVTKIWSDRNDQDGARPSSVTVRLLADGAEVQFATISGSGNAWSYTFTDLPKYRDGGAEIVYTITEDTVPGYTPTVNRYNITNTYVPETTSISGSKTWEDDNDRDGARPDSITITLLADGVAVTGKTITVTEADDWKWSFTDLPKYRDGGVEIVYTITEAQVAGYTTTYDAAHLNVTNTYTPETTSVSGSKTWEDDNDRDGARPDSITITLLADDVAVAGKTITVTEADDWKWSFTDLPKYRDGGVEIVYTIAEVQVAGYTTAYDAAHLNVTNTYTPDTTSVSGSKTWEDDNDRDGVRPDSITITLLADDVAVTGKTITVTEADDWKWSFTDLPKYRDGGVEIVYTIEEAQVAGYTTTYDAAHLNVTNTYTPDTTSISGSKTWEDDNDRDGVRPDSITITLLADDVAVTGKTITVTEADDWKWSFTDLPKYRDGGVEIVYTIEEAQVAGYTTTYDAAHLNVTNTYDIAKTSVSGSKTWEDDNDRDGVRPDSITITLLADDVAVAGKTITVTEADNWKWSFTDLPKYRDGGVEIVYTIEEAQVAGYTTTYDAAHLNVTNTYDIAKISVSGTKTWNDSNDQDGKRPTSITVNLLADGTEIRETIVTEGADGSWKYSFTDLPKYKDGGVEIKYTITEDAVEDYSTSVKDFNITNSYTPGETSVTVTKVWDDANNQDNKRPGSVKVQLYADGVASGNAVVLKESGKWTYTWTKLPINKDGKPITYTVEEVDTLGEYTPTVSGDAKKGFIITNTYKPETISVSGTKTWVDADNQDGIRPTEITVNLFADGKEVKEVKVTEGTDGSWKYSFTDLPKYAAGKEIVYTITEDAVTGYTTKVDGFNVTNTHIPETTSISGTKTWVDADNQDGMRPTEITVNLLADGKEVKEVKITEGTDGSWKYSFTDLPKYAAGKEIVYTITEDAVTGYTAKVDGFNVTNTHTPETTSVGGTKTWDDGNNQDNIRPNSITVNLFANGKEVMEQKVTAGADGSWTYSFTDLPKYNKGSEIKYTVTEDAVTGYTTTIKGFDITNVHKPETLNFHIEKVWSDADNQDGKRPTSIQVQLLKNGVVEKTQEITEANGWKWSFNDLAQYENGKVIVWSVQEVAVSGYTSIYTETSATDGKVITITNSHSPEIIAISGTKTWNDADNQDNKRPASITINLLANGTEIRSTEVKEAADGTWTYEFTGLPKYSAGKEIIYTVTEDVVADYTTSINGYNITNTYTPGKTSVTVTKVWEDANNQDGLRPNEIEVQLYADGVAAGNAVVLSEANNWTHIWSDLDAMKAGTAIAYTVDEPAVAVGYAKEITGSAMHGYTITNKHVALTTEVKVTKVWDDENDKDGLRPDSIEVQLYADGSVKGSAVLLNETNGWTYTWTGLEEKNAGKDISYTVKEIAVPDKYTNAVTGDAENGYTITNTHVVEYVSIAGSKTWDDKNNLGNIRPASITVHLLADGILKETKTVTEADGWSWDFGNAWPKYKDGKEIVYTITEDAVENYSAKIDGFNITNITPAVYGSVEVTKKLLGDGKIITAKDDVFYVALYLTNDDRQQPVSEVKSIAFKDASIRSVVFENVEVGKTYYVRECDANGNPISAGQTEDGIKFVATFEDGKNEILLNTKDEQAEVTLVNTFEKLPEEYYMSGELQITKKLLDSQGTEKNSSEIFYAGIFADKDCTKLSDLVSENIVKLALGGTSQATATVQVTVWGTEQKLYIAEVDKDGKVVQSGKDFGYDITVDSAEVVLNMDKSSVAVTITNKEYVEPPKPSTNPSTNPTPAPVTTPSPTPAPNAPTSPKTGDNVPVGGMLWVFLAAMAVGTYSLQYRKEKRKEK